MNFRSEITIRKPDGSLLPPIVLLHEDDDILSGVLFMQSMGRQMSWHRNGELCGLSLQVEPAPEDVSGEAASVPTPTKHDFEDLFAGLDSPACSPNGALAS